MWRLSYVSGTELLPETSEFCRREGLNSVYTHFKQLHHSANSEAIDRDVKYLGYIIKHQMKLKNHQNQSIGVKGQSTSNIE